MSWTCRSDHGIRSMPPSPFSLLWHWCQHKGLSWQNWSVSGIIENWTLITYIRIPTCLHAHSLSYKTTYAYTVYIYSVCIHFRKMKAKEYFSSSLFLLLLTWLVFTVQRITCLLFQAAPLFHQLTLEGALWSPRKLSTTVDKGNTDFPETDRSQLLWWKNVLLYTNSPYKTVVVQIMEMLLLSCRLCPDSVFLDLALSTKSQEKAEELGITLKLDICGLYRVRPLLFYNCMHTCMCICTCIYMYVHIIIYMHVVICIFITHSLKMALMYRLRGMATLHNHMLTLFKQILLLLYLVFLLHQDLGLTLTNILQWHTWLCSGYFSLQSSQTICSLT